MPDTVNNEAAQVLQWNVPVAVGTSLPNTIRNRFAERLSSLPVEKIEVLYTEYTEQQMDALLRLASGKVLRRQLAGTGVDLGGGVGLLSSCLAKIQGVEKVYCVELAENLVRGIAPRIVRAVLGPGSPRVVLVAGTFDHLELPDGALDFAVELSSLHHSDDLKTTFSEAGRVIRPGGYMLCIDRIQPDSMTEEEVEARLSEVYSEEFLEQYGIPGHTVLTRRENGEHEYRLSEWKKAWECAGFRCMRMRTIRPTVGARDAVKGLVSLAPGFISRRMVRTPVAAAKSLMYIRQVLRIGYSHWPRNRTLTILALRKTEG